MNYLHRLSVLCLKFAPFIGGILMWLHITCLLLGKTFYVVENLIGLPIIPCLTAIVWSKAFGFCPMHRCFIAYICAITYCINWQADFVGFGTALLGVRWGLWVIGLLLIIWFIYNLVEKKCQVC